MPGVGHGPQTCLLFLHMPHPLSGLPAPAHALPLQDETSVWEMRSSQQLRDPKTCKPLSCSTSARPSTSNCCGETDELPKAPNSSFEGGNGCREQEGCGARCPRELAARTHRPGTRKTPGHKGAEADPAETPPQNDSSQSLGVNYFPGGLGIQFTRFIFLSKPSVFFPYMCFTVSSWILLRGGQFIYH